MLSCYDVASYFLSLQDEEIGDTITNLKLQKLLYYAQGYYIALRGKKLFPERIEAWEHGPVVPEVYQKYKKYRANSIRHEFIELDNYSEDEIEVLDAVNKYIGQYSAWKLRNMTHEEPPWKKAYGRSLNNEITETDLREYFLTLITDEED
jgi:uncharacterized phage-associated protein